MRFRTRIAAAVTCAIMLAGLCACGVSTPTEPRDTSVADSPTAAPTEADLTSIHGYFDPDDSGQLFFRGQAYYVIFLTDYSQLILDNPMLGEAYITDESITDDEEAKEKGAVIRFDLSQELPDILMMTVEDYFRGKNYDPDLYPEYKYYCKREESQSRFRKLQTQAFNNMYITNYEQDEKHSALNRIFSIGQHDILDDETTQAIRATAKDKDAESIGVSVLKKGQYTMLCVHRCDKNMLVDPMIDEYYLIRMDDGRYYVGDWYSDRRFIRVSAEREGVIDALIGKYPYTAMLHTNWMTEMIEKQNTSDHQT